MTANKTALLIAFAFPPFGGGGVQRTAKYAKLLPQHGWRPIVLTCQDCGISVRDEKLAQEVEGTEVHRLSCSLLPKPNGGTPPSLLSRIHRRLYSYFSLFFTGDIGWIPQAIRKGRAIARKENVDMIYATGNPFGTFLAALAISTLTGIPYVVDYRDSWSFSEFNWEGNRISRFFSRFWERLVLKYAKAIIVAKPKMIEHNESLLPGSKEKTTLITNGYDKSDFPAPKKAGRERSSHKFEIVFTGVMWRAAGLHNPKGLIQALHELKKEDKLSSLDIEYTIYGSVDPYYTELLKTSPIASQINLKGYVDHKTVVKAQQDADILALIISSEEGYQASLKYSGIIPGKIFEYIASGTPILAIVPENGFEAELINKTQTGEIARPGNIKEIKEKLLKLIERRNSFSPCWSEIEQYSRQSLTGKFAEVLDKASLQSSRRKELKEAA